MDRRRMIIGTSAVVIAALIALLIVVLNRPDGPTRPAVQLTTPSPISPSESTLAPGSTSPATPESIPEEVVWAGQVCTALGDLKRVAENVPEQALRDFDPSRDLGVQAEEQVGKAMTTLQTPLDALAFRLGSVPIDYVQSAETLIEARRLTNRARLMVDATRNSITEALAADSVVTGVLLFGQAVVNGRDAYDTARELIGVLGGFDRDERLRGSFGLAPECRAI